MSEFAPVMRTPELGPGTVAEVHAHGDTIALANIGQQYFAVAAHCPEDGTNLARDGVIEGDRLICPTDNSAYDMRTGHRVDGRHDAALRRYRIRIQENDILVGPPIDA
jgi:nitrite reductase/ring-hydroxylating ferredoxin subunit